MGNHDEFDLDVRLTVGRGMWASRANELAPEDINLTQTFDPCDCGGGDGTDTCGFCTDTCGDNCVPTRAGCEPTNQGRTCGDACPVQTDQGNTCPATQCNTCPNTCQTCQTQCNTCPATQCDTCQTCQTQCGQQTCQTCQTRCGQDTCGAACNTHAFTCRCP